MFLTTQHYKDWPTSTHLTYQVTITQYKITLQTCTNPPHLCHHSTIQHNTHTHNTIHTIHYKYAQILHLTFPITVTQHYILIIRIIIILIILTQHYKPAHIYPSHLRHFNTIQHNTTNLHTSILLISVTIAQYNTTLQNAQILHHIIPITVTQHYILIISIIIITLTQYNTTLQTCTNHPFSFPSP